MRNHEETICDDLLLYAAGEGTQADRIEFERHLSTCPACRAELANLREVWEAMPLLADQTDVPDDMKSDVMSGIFGREADGPVLIPPKRRTGLFSIVAAAVVLLLASGYALWSAGSGKDEYAFDANTVQTPMQVLQTYKLNAVDRAVPAAGTVWLLEGKENNQVVVHLQGLPMTSGDEAYQVWLIHNGERYNCGTLLVDGQGTGVLTYPIKKEAAFEAVGVTLEPDSKGTQPRGKKVLGS
ncbi:hypothetical protein J31TS4_40930 [Paenibacillus sp. J31TS4]|uniref:anti-sigma factor n=1 Tax=Paenibacillus sp. J31TS4 TaxID=2807195 RepID=UPI001B09593F|nr:anti-sigma factor [Paenibacillus sp. J31TS4]GIP40813.1 hypothetical protein J31TS4_40930 [Paenibacillus sp. J31TS4]